MRLVSSGHGSACVCDADVTELTHLGFLQYPPAKQARAAYACKVCSKAAVGASARICTAVIRRGAALLYFCRRLYPDEPSQWAEADHHLRLALSALEQREFQATKDGAGCFRLDRTSLYVTGPLADLYEQSVCSSSWLRAWLFACGVCRS